MIGQGTVPMNVRAYLGLERGQYARQSRTRRIAGGLLLGAVLATVAAVLAGDRAWYVHIGIIVAASAVLGVLIGTATLLVERRQDAATQDPGTDA